MKLFSTIHMTAGLMILAAAMTVSGASAPLMELRPEAQSDSQGVFLDQVVTGTNAAHVRLTAAPAFGSFTLLNRAQVLDLIKKNAPEFASTNWAGAAKIKITRQARPFSADDLTTLLTGTLQKEYIKDKGQVELRLTRQWVTMNMPAEPLNLRVIEMPGSGLTTLCVLRSEIRCGDELIGTWSIPIEAHLWRDVWVAQSPMKRGDRLQTSSLSKERRDILQLKDVCLTETLDDDSLELTENLNVGSALLNRAVRAHPVIQRGRMVDAVVSEGVMMITVKALALEDGATGQTIRMKNPKSGGEFRGKVQNEQTVQVTL